MSLGDRITADREREWAPEAGDRVRIGPVMVGAHEWVGEFLRWSASGAHCHIMHSDEGEVVVRRETLRGPAHV